MLEPNRWHQVNSSSTEALLMKNFYGSEGEVGSSAFFSLILRGGGTWKKHQVRDVVAYFIPALWSSLFLRDGRGITKKPFLGNFTSWFGLLTNFFVYTSLQTQLNLFASLCMFATKLPGTTCLSPDIFPHMPYFYRLIFPAKYWPDTVGVHMK